MTHTSPKVAVIPAAGKGTRFLPSTKATPKEMHPLLNLPLIHHCLKELSAAGVEEVIIVTHREKVALEKYFGDHSELKQLLTDHKKTNLVQELENIEKLPKVRFAYQEEQLGLAHAVYSAKEEIANRDFFLLLPDEIFLPQDQNENPCVVLKEMFEQTGTSTIALLEVDPVSASQYGVAKIEKDSNNNLNVLEIVEKPAPEEAPSNLMLPGRYVLKASILEQIEQTPEKNGEVQFTDSLVLLSKEIGLHGFVTQCPRFDGGSVLGFLKANIYAAMKNPKLKDDLKGFLKDLS